MPDHRRRTSSRSRYTGQGGPRLGLPGAGHQRGRRADRRPGRASACSASTCAPATGCTASSPTAASRQHHPGPHRRASGWSGPTTVEQLDELQAKVTRCFEAGALATGRDARVIATDSARYSEMRHDAELPRACTGATPRPSGAASPSYGAGRGAGSTDMGNVSLAVPVDPPHASASTPARRSTTSPSSPPTAPPRPPTRRCSTAPWPWPGPRSTPPPTRPCASGCWPAPARGPDAGRAADVRVGPAAPTSLVRGTDGGAGREERP